MSPPPLSALLTDLYELTMAAGYWKSGLADVEAVFHIAFRHLPFSGGYAVAAGLGDAIERLAAFRFAEDELTYLTSLEGSDGSPLFDGAFLERLRRMRFTCDVEALPEGTLVFPQEPLIRVRGPLDQAQIVETVLLNLINFQTLIATKSARICLAAAGDPVIEFGLRRAQGVDGGLAATRAAYVGGCDATSNVLAGKRFGIPVKGTHAHSWVMAFGSEAEAFRAYAEAMPHNCILLVDTFDSLRGVHEAVRVGRWMREHGGDLAGIRLDSGDLAYLSAEARRILDAGGFPDAVIVGSNELDEHVIASLKAQGSAISVWGVGTRMVTGGGDPALGGIYKLAALRRGPGAAWEYKLKLSDDVGKISVPGILNVRRFTDGGVFAGDMIYDELDPPAAAERLIIDPASDLRQKAIPSSATSENLLVPIFRAGRQVYTSPPLSASRERALASLRSLHPATKRLLNPHEYPAGLSPALHARRAALIAAARPK